MTGINRDEWLRALKDANAPPEAEPDGTLTVRELAGVLGCSIKYAYEVGEKLVATGKAEIVHRPVYRVQGGRRNVKAYRLLNPTP